MTDKELTGLELRKAVAEKIGWTQVVIEGEPEHEEMYGVYPGCDYAVGLIPSYELSLDACLKDVVPWAQSHDCFMEIREIGGVGKGWSVIFWHRMYGSAYRGASETDIPEALCRAVLKLEG